MLLSSCSASPAPSPAPHGHLDVARGLEGPLAGEHLVEHHAQRPLVAAGVGQVALPGVLLGAHVGRRARSPFQSSATPPLVSPGHAEVHDQRLAVAVDHHVGRLHVAVDDPLRVGVVQRQGQLLDQLGRFPLWQLRLFFASRRPGFWPSIKPLAMKYELPILPAS